MNETEAAIFTDLTSHALAAAIRTLEVYPDPTTKGDVFINLAGNAGVTGCMYLIGVLAPDLYTAEGEDGVMREALRLWRRVAGEYAKPGNDEQLADRIHRVTRNFKPRYRDGRSAYLLDQRKGAA